jgi:hypothetical protein
MLYKLTPTTAVELVASDPTLAVQTTTWHLADWSLWIGGFQDGYELEALAETSLGSYHWYGDDVDTLLFSRETKQAHAAALRLPEAVQLSEASSFATATQQEHTTNGLVLRTEVNFRLVPGESTIYVPIEDTLSVLMVADASPFEYDQAAQVFPDLSLLFLQGNYVGWRLSNASRCIPSALGEQEESGRAKKIAYLTQYLSFFEESTRLRLDEGEPVIEQELHSIKNKIAKENDSSLFEIEKAIDRLLEAYY